MGGAWGYVPNDHFKSSAKVIRTLAEIVAKEEVYCSVLVQDQMVSDEQVTRLKEIGNWLKVNGDAIYNTRTTDQYQDLNIFFYKEKDGKLYAIVCLEKQALSFRSVMDA